MRVLFRFAIVFISSLIACEEEDLFKIIEETLFNTGWNYRENYTQSIPVAINYGNYQSSSTLPASVDLISHFPPVGDQGQIGTCVAWAVGYSNKSYLDGLAKNLSSIQLQTPLYQYSPTDLFFSISPTKRSCMGGTFFEEAFNILISRGVNTMASVPYNAICYDYSPGSPSTAAANKIKNYRRIQGSVNEIKEYLAQGIPIVFGAMVNSEFEMWRGSGVLTNLNYRGDEGGHAMVIAGYDDSKQAFRIINSWGRTWGDNGYAWIGYDFMVNKFCVQGGQRALFVTFNDNNISINPTPGLTSPDLAAIVNTDYSVYPQFSSFINSRFTAFDVKNIGNQVIDASANWNIYYMWINAFNANEYGLIFRGEFTTNIPKNTYQNVNANYSLINFDLQPGSSLAQTIFGVPNITWNYFMPTLTGSYYLVMYIDKGKSYEVNQANNVFYVTQSPKFFSNGYSSKTMEEDSNKFEFENILSFKHELVDSNIDDQVLFQYNNLSNTKFMNSYTSEEIVSFLKFKIQNGGL